ncbi:MAG: glycosyltransferase [Pseudonocardia sp.]|uniref:bifunctional polysaccharide deacetylase/glycosyltransferase family 2 protein n=1 Tax=Pseudonocardia sp. TaxID=60912 RepID=UPI001ACF1A0A|nr:glycosyltransferase [Pseudonocardia sp.]MBN9102807.1 glycosyltransferase [Pseudonocardia sp.]
MRILRRPTWVLSVAILLVFGTVLVIDGTVRGSTLTEAPAPAVAGPNGQVPFAVAHGAPVVDVRSSPIRTFAPARGTIAFTIDGGPDPSRTAQLLGVLSHFGVPATFFVSGAVVAQHPEAARSILGAGSEIGIRTFTSQDLASVSDTRLDRELTLTELALAGAVDRTTYLVRPPYSASVAGLDDEHFALVRRLADHGMVSVFSDVSAAGWTRRTTDEILATVVTPDKAGRVISVDASEGGPAQLASALARVIPALRDRGYTFATVTRATGLPPAGQQARERDKAVGDGMLAVVAVSTTIVAALGWLLLVAGGLVLLRLALMLVFAIYHSVRRNPKRFRWGPPVTAPVSVIVPAYNEKECIAATVRSLMASEHPIEIIVVDDGSTDDTAAIVRGLNLPGVRLIRQANGGKPAALNNGIKHARHEIVVMIDGDTVFEPSTVRLLVQPFARPEVGAVSGNAKVANRKKLVGRWQHIEYVIGFNIDRRIQDLLGCMTTIPGAVGAFRRTALLQAGLVSDDTLAEDTDLTMAVCAAGWQIVYEERARAWTEAPTTLQQLWRQRYRWSYGTMQAMWKHRGSVFRSGPAGRMGRVGLLNLALFQVMLPMLAPLIDVFLVYGLVALDPVRTLQLWGAVLGIQMLSGLLAFGMERENPLPLLWMPLQQLVYRQMMYAVLIKSMGTALAGVRLRWQKLKRVGDFGGAGAAAGGR